MVPYTRANTPTLGFYLIIHPTITAALVFVKVNAVVQPGAGRCARAFLPPTDPRARSTVDAIGRRLKKDGLVLRYRAGRFRDGLLPSIAPTTGRTSWSCRSTTRRSATRTASRPHGGRDHRGALVVRAGGPPAGHVVPPRWRREVPHDGAYRREHREHLRWATLACGAALEPELSPLVGGMRRSALLGPN